MSDIELGELMGALVSGVTKARGMSDVTTAEIAGVYSKSEVLSGLSLPRFRIKEIDFDVPFVVTGVEKGDAFYPEKTSVIVNKTLDLVEQEAKNNNFKLDAETKAKFTSALKQNVDAVMKSSEEDFSDSRNVAVFKQKIAESARRALSSALVDVKKKSLDDQKNQVIAVKKMSVAINEEVGNFAVVKEGTKGKIVASILTQDIKEHGTPDTVSRIRMTLSEEGLEWSHEQDDSTGVVNSKLLPE